MLFPNTTANNKSYKRQTKKQLNKNDIKRYLFSSEDSDINFL